MNLTSQCQYNAKSEKTVLDDNVKMEDRWVFLAELCVQDME